MKRIYFCDFIASSVYVNYKIYKSKDTVFWLDLQSGRAGAVGGHYRYGSIFSTWQVLFIENVQGLLDSSSYANCFKSYRKQKSIELRRKLIFSFQSCQNSIKICSVFTRFQKKKKLTAKKQNTLTKRNY